MRSACATPSSDTSNSHSGATDGSTLFDTRTGTPASSYLSLASTPPPCPSTPPPHSMPMDDPLTPHSWASKETVNSMISSWRPSPIQNLEIPPTSLRKQTSQREALGSPFRSPRKRVAFQKRIREVYEIIRDTGDIDESCNELFKRMAESLLSETSALSFVPPDDAQKASQSGYVRFVQERSERARREWLSKSTVAQSRYDLPANSSTQHCTLPTWLPYLMAGITDQEHMDSRRQINATDLVRHGLGSKSDGNWNGEMVLALVEQLCWVASEKFSLRCPGTVAPFAYAVSSERILH